AGVRGLGFSRGYILKKNVVDFLSEKMSPRQWKTRYFERLKKSKVPTSYRIERVTRGNGARTLDITAVYLPFEGQEFILSIARDVTRQTQLQRALQDSKNLYRFLAEGAGEGIAALDLDGRFTYANRTLLQMFDIAPSQYAKRRFLDFIPKAGLSQATEMFDRVRKGKEGVQQIIGARSATGSLIPVEVHVTPFVKNGTVVSIHVIVRDLRLRQQMEQASRQAEKMDALRYFIAGTAQELKNPLMGVVTRADKLLQKYHDRDFEYIGYKEFLDILRNVESIRDRVRHCHGIAERLSSMGQKEAGLKSGHCDVHQVIRQLSRDREHDLQQYEIRIRLALVTSPVEVAMSQVDLVQVLSNLIDNAVQAMLSGGVVTIRTRLVLNGCQLLIEIADQGVGIPPEQLDHIFEPFFTTKTRGPEKNSGLGLSIVYSLVQSAQGDVKVASSLRKGTIVKVSLPVYQLRKK
ncbi:MAG TPA: ATP-binding protein, partial [Candidatus Bathyarchaeia archaeon]|nr:ATP-binding protein [Candidatus Bathyarchaeia archaeon]